MGIGIEIEDIDWQSHPSMELPFIPEIQKTVEKVFDRTATSLRRLAQGVNLYAF